MILETYSKHKKLLVGIFLVLLIIGVALLIWQSFPKKEIMTICTDEVMVCPDGTSVSRIGPDCAFAACPVADTGENVNNEVVEGENSGSKINIPEVLPANFITASEWPPRVDISKDNFSCQQTAGNASQASRTLKKINEEQSFCIEVMSEGSAGSVYTDYIYTTQKEDALVTVKFTLRYPQCDNYDEPKKTQCNDERKLFDIDSVIKQIVDNLQTSAKSW